MKDLKQALSFLTVIPLPGARKGGLARADGSGLPDRAADRRLSKLARAMIFFPLVGFLIGTASLLIGAGLSTSLFPRLQALALVTLPILLTGGLHLDGFADFCDGFGGKNKEEILRIMRDSHVGVWGVAGVLLLLIWKMELLAALPSRGGAFLLSLTASRWAQVVLAYFLPYANPEGGLGESVAKKVKVRELSGATGFLAVLVFFLGVPGLVTFLALLPFLVLAGFLFFKRVGGITGDLLGAASEATEVYVLFIFLLIKTGGLS